MHTNLEENKEDSGEEDDGKWGGNLQFC